MARPTTLTPETAALICDALRGGNTRKASAAYAGVEEACFREWVRKGNKGVEPYAAFTDALRKAEADAVVRNVAIVQKAASTSWQASAWWLERKFPADWSRDQTIIRRLEKQVAELEKALGTRDPSPV